MRILLDARMWRWTGIGTYVRVLLEGFGEILQGGGHEVICLVPPADLPVFPLPCGPDVSSVVRVVPCSVRVYSPWEISGLRGALRSRDFDLAHFPHYIFPYRGGFPVVVTIHDLIHLHFPSYHKTPLHYAYARHVLPRSAQAARRIITVSRYSKDDIVSRLEVPPEKVKIIPNGLARDFAPDPDGDAALRVQKAVGLDGPYVLYVGNGKAHKNFHGLLRAYRRLTERMDREAPGRKKLTLAATICRKELRPRTADAGLEGVHFLGSVSGGTLTDLYRAAAVFAFPSRYEGFGYPPLEAMACGTPVVCSNATSLPEVVGDAAIQVPPDNLDRLSSALYDLLTREDLRIRLRNEGLKRVKSFTARGMAQAAWKVYEEAVEIDSAARDE